MRTFTPPLCAAAALWLAACSGTGSTTPPDYEPRVVAGADTHSGTRAFTEVQLVANPNAPAGPNGEVLPWARAAVLPGVRVFADRDSAVVAVPTLAGARDFRVFVLRPGVQVASVAGLQTVRNADIFCAGDRQLNAPKPAAPQVMHQIELLDLKGPSVVVVEALASQCPFTGPRVSEHYTTRVDSTEVTPAERVTFSLFTEAEIVGTYGSMIFNGHAPGPSLAAPASPANPVVLARTAFTVSPKGIATIPVAFFDDFNEGETPHFVRTLPTFSDRNSNGALYETSKYGVYVNNFDHVDYIVDRGQLQVTLTDRYQNVFATSFFTPRRPVQLSDTDYLHVTFTVGSNATQRRYWWLFLCGASAAGQTFDTSGRLRGNLVQTSFFYQDDGRNPVVEGWNCLQVFPRDGSPFTLPPDETRAQSDVRVMVNLPRTDLNNVVNVSPDQYGPVAGPSVAPPGWYRQQDGRGTLTGVILDDQMVIAPRTQYDFYIRRDRVIMLVNGEQRLCNDFPSVSLTMAEGALGFGQVLYHTTAERNEFSADYDDRTGQQYYLNNTPYVDARSWDSVGYQENTAAPTDFDPGTCYVYR
jgi:hypothetical protein